MNQFEARISLVMFLCITALVSANALFYQPALGLGAPPSLNIKPPLFAKTALVRDIQTELVTRGYKPGNIRGKLTLQTSAAILAYEHDAHLPLTGRESSALLQHILLGSLPPTKKMAAHETLFVWRFKERIHTVLQKTGFRASPGTLPETHLSSMILQFERKWNLPLTGRISGQMLQTLAQITGDNVS